MGRERRSWWLWDVRIVGHTMFPAMVTYAYNPGPGNRQIDP